LERAEGKGKKSQDGDGKSAQLEHRMQESPEQPDYSRLAPVRQL
jgi:hypothetical protein